MLTISSKEVAELLGKRHDNFKRDIKKYIASLGEEAPKYFIEGIYKDTKGKDRVEYKITVAGCNLIAGRMIGEKGNSFREKFQQIFPPEEEPKKESELFNLPESTDLTVEEVAKRLGCTERNVYRTIKKGKLKSVQKIVLIPTTKTFVTEESLSTYITERGRA